MTQWEWLGRGGRENIGQAHRTAKLSDADVQRIRAEYASGKRGTDEARRYGICRDHYNRIGKGTRRA